MGAGEGATMMWTIVPDTVSQQQARPCSSWGASKELELEKCEGGPAGLRHGEDFQHILQDLKVMAGKAPGAWAISAGQVFLVVFLGLP